MSSVFKPSLAVALVLGFATTAYAATLLVDLPSPARGRPAPSCKPTRAPTSAKQKPEPCA